MRIKWLHLSDIHFNFKSFDSNTLREDFLKRIAEMSKHEAFTHLFLTGDILYRNAIADSDTVPFINKLIDVSGVTKDHVFLVPGNHDHDRAIPVNFWNSHPSKELSVIDSISTDDVTLLLDSFSNFESVFTEIFKNSYYGSTQNPHLIYEDSSLAVIKLNSAWLDTDSSGNNSLFVGSYQLQSLLSPNSHQISGKLKIAIGHHPLDDFAESERNRILDLFRRNEIGIYLCGHRHKPNIQYYDKYDVIEFTAPGGYNDGYSEGGYIWGIIDTDQDFYQAEVFSWENGNFCIESRLSEVDDYGIHHFHSKRFSHKSDVVAIDCKTMWGHIVQADLAHALCTDKFDIQTLELDPNASNGYSAEMIEEFAQEVLSLAQSGKVVHLFPLAPIPLLLQLGFDLQNTTKIHIHQYDRYNNCWVYNGKKDDIVVSVDTNVSNCDILVISISTSASVTDSQIEKIMCGKRYDVLRCTSSNIQVGYPLFYSDVKTVATEIISALNRIIANYSEIHIFAAIPAGLAIELGRNMLPSIYSNVHTYQLTKGQYEPSLIINKPTPQDFHENPVAIKEVRFVNIPILGRIPCGPLNEAYPENEEYYPIPESALGKGDYFIITASGDSMINAGINDGDYVLVRQQTTANNGDIVVALIGTETTLKRINYDNVNQKIILKPENENYHPYVYDRVDIQGVAVSVIKNLK